jgi:hypothetical protein
MTAYIVFVFMVTSQLSVQQRQHSNKRRARHQGPTICWSRTLEPSVGWGHMGG